MIRRIILTALLISPCLVKAQITYGTAGLLHAPSAEMEQRGTVMFGGTFMNKELTPPNWNYHTFGYYLNATLLPWFELSYKMNLMKVHSYKGYKMTNQDRNFSVRVRLVTEGQYHPWMPAIVIGNNDIGTGSSEYGEIRETGNGYFSRYYIAATKHIEVGPETVGVHLGYVYNRRTDYPLNGPTLGVSWHPQVLPDLKVIAEYDSKDISIGAQYLFFNHLLVTADMQRLQYFSGGVTYKVYLK